MLELSHMIKQNFTGKLVCPIDFFPINFNLSHYRGVKGMTIWPMADIVYESSERNSQNGTFLILKFVLLLIVGNQKLNKSLREKCSTNAVLKSGMSSTWKNVFKAT